MVASGAFRRWMNGAKPGGDWGGSGSGLDERLYYLTDANANVTAVVNTSGEAVERYAYDPYGEVQILNGASGVDADVSGGVTEWDADADGTSDVANEILYCGYRYDPETGLYHVRNRMYHPRLGAWLQRDPLGYVDGMSLYEYVASEPVGQLDPMGEKITYEGDWLFNLKMRILMQILKLLDDDLSNMITELECSDKEVKLTKERDFKRPAIVDKNTGKVVRPARVVRIVGVFPDKLQANWRAKLDKGIDVYYYASNRLVCGGIVRNLAEMAHELQHCHDIVGGTVLVVAKHPTGFKSFKDPKGMMDGYATTLEPAAIRTQNIVHDKFGIPLETHYGRLNINRPGPNNSPQKGGPTADIEFKNGIPKEYVWEGEK